MLTPDSDGIVRRAIPLKYPVRENQTDMTEGSGIPVKVRLVVGMSVKPVWCSIYRLASGALEARSALPVARPTATSVTAAEMGSAGGGKVTPVRYEHGQQDGSGQEEYAVHICTHNR